MAVAFAVAFATHLMGAAAAQDSTGDGAKPERHFDASFAGGPAAGRPHDGLREFCTASCWTTPARLTPGASGKLTLVLALRGRAVIPAAGRLRLGYASQQHGVHLGDWTLAAATAGTLAKAFVGKPVYENTATIEIPLAVDAAAGAPAGADAGAAAAGGSRTLLLTLDADVYDGETGSLICAAQMPVEARVDVAPDGGAFDAGRHGAGPASVLGRRGIAAPAAAAAPDGGSLVRTALPSPAAATASDAPRTAGDDAAASETQTPAASSSSGVAPSSVPGGWLLPATGILLLVAVAGLLLARRT